MCVFVFVFVFVSVCRVSCVVTLWKPYVNLPVSRRSDDVSFSKTLESTRTRWKNDQVCTTRLKTREATAQEKECAENMVSCVPCVDTPPRTHPSFADEVRLNLHTP